MEYVVKVNGMSCNGCANSVKAALSKMEGITQVEVRLDDKEAVMQSNQAITQDQVENALADTSYTVETFSN
ncbi:heavy-metal-associated domain-containing protein [Alkalibacterium sp. MB6]|uniref:heavy-metal-associated domain-containing protein n=1 Tax=Alkalibacterium sp. MB6 TaxID=2081965 RepID=UPI00137ABDB2|nr:heavy metal-associated domain-containing protein [Alkalibacterium sp. MB6]